jgi:BMFP domain-containing protein YqiC
MFDPKHLENLAQKLYASLPSKLHHVEHDLQEQFKDILRSAFSRMDLVTREEFDVQIKVLARTREKVDLLERQIQTLLDAKKDVIQ